MSKLSKVLLGLLALAAAFSGYSLYNKYFVKNDATVVESPAPAVVPAPVPVVVAPVESKPEMPLERVLPKIFAEEQPMKEAPIRTAEVVKSKPRSEAVKDTTVAKRVAGETKKVVGVVVDGTADAVDTTIDAVKKAGNAIANAKCSGDNAWKKDKECQWVRDTWSGTIGPWNQPYYDYYTTK